jgi:hypothetical protein
MVKFIECACESNFQDKTYGKQKRAMNDLPKKAVGDKKEYRCTVCERVHP